MAIQKIGYTKKTKSGKATLVSLSDKDIELIRSTAYKFTGKDGAERTSYSVMISGDINSQYGHSLSILTKEDNAPVPQPTTGIDPNELLF